MLNLYETEGTENNILSRIGGQQIIRQTHLKMIYILAI